MIKNGLYSLNAITRDGVADDVGGVLILRDGQMHAEQAVKLPVVKAMADAARAVVTE